ncbi:MAG TPA: hypothetical protein VGD37_15740 [Kofleriaceae bacterium]|jgi:hypothetical protein
MTAETTEVATWRALYRVAHGLRYRELPELIGQRVTITSPETTGESLRRLAGRWLAEGAVLRHPEIVEGTLFKYGMIDAELDAARGLLDHEATIVGLDVMRECGFLPRRGEPWAADDVACGAGFAHDLAGDLVKNEGIVKLWLRDDIPVDEHMQWLSTAVNHGVDRPGRFSLPSGYLPRELTVADACVTNASFVWFSRHLYL